MPPNIGGGTVPEREDVINNSGSANGKEKLEIYYDGYFYDVTDFVDRHPGGNVIKFYTEKGEDATQAIQQFHYRSRDRVEAIMKSFKKRPAPQQERGLEPTVLTRHEALSADFKKLTEELQAEGYFEPDIKHVILRVWECLMFCVLSIALGVYCETFSGKFFSCILIGFAYSRCGWVWHEGGHNSLTGRPKIDKFIQMLAGCVPLGGSAVWWNSQHNRHHAMPQRLHHDVDLATLPYVAFHKRAVTKKEQIHNVFIRYQAFFYFTLDLLVVTIAWRWIIHPRYQLKKKAYLELLLGIPSVIFGFYQGPIYIILVGYWFAFFMGTNFALSHTHLEVTDKPTHWIEYGLTHTANISNNMFVDCWMGYLNYQIEHHLFPTMPQFRQRLIAHRVKALAEKYDLPYRVFTYPEACKLALKNLDHVGRELTGPSMFRDED